MKKIYAVIFCLLSMGQFASSQIIYPNPYVLDSTTFTFAITDTLSHFFGVGCGGCDTTDISVDASLSTLWQIGSTLKPVFSNDTDAQRGIMTDTAHPYPRNTNTYFTLKIDHAVSNCIIDIWHKYETNGAHAGCILEFSTDTATSWINVADCPAVLKQNIYAASDTVFSGAAAFNGVSSSEQLSRIQFINCWAFRSTSTACAMIDNFGDGIPLYLRFRFVSDTSTDTLSGWKIDSIRIENPGCIPGAVNKVAVPQSGIEVFPNPAGDEVTVNAGSGTLQSIVMVNVMGQTVYTRLSDNHSEILNVGDLPNGIYNMNILTGTGQRFNRKIVIMR